ncbi:hypothetical protein FD755_022526 [Muntiacus reevesi]|uniref:Uncharacterized protein n=1 Tax=Muntiacus reevesi TaxID=9886 RepID=A0A5N3W084_MUNRE|nr:hypothetical protein FD755_022526 [Muntiacus reevesi]
MNGFSTEKNCRERSPAAPAAARGYGLSCLLIEEGNASYREKRKAPVYLRFLQEFHPGCMNKRQRKTSDDGRDSPEHDTDIPEADLFQLQVNTLRRYKRHFADQIRLQKGPETLTFFIYMMKSNKSRLDQKSEGGKQLE